MDAMSTLIEAGMLLQSARGSIANVDEGYGRFVGGSVVGGVGTVLLPRRRRSALIGRHRGAHNRLGFAVQLTTVRFFGVFLEDPVGVPWPVVEFLAGQLEVGDPSAVKRYSERPRTAYEHAWKIRDAFGFRSFDDVLAAEEFATFLAARRSIRRSSSVMRSRWCSMSTARLLMWPGRSG